MHWDMHYPLVQQLLADGAIVVVTSGEPVGGGSDRQVIARTVIQLDGDTVTQVRATLNTDSTRRHRQKLDATLGELGWEVLRLRRVLQLLICLSPIAAVGLAVVSGGVLGLVRPAISWCIAAAGGNLLFVVGLGLVRWCIRQALRPIIGLR